MTFQEKINQLRGRIKEVLTPLITGDYVLLDNPYHTNIGDVLIWEGERSFLSSLPYHCLGSSSLETWRWKPLSPATVILLQGGGNFGDLWPCFHEFKKQVIKEYPENRIIMFPQSVWYDDESLIEKDTAVMAQHKDLYLCARDRWSYDFMREHFGANHVMLVPDMAFCIDDSLLDGYRRKNIPGKVLYFKRTDKELDDTTLIQTLPNTDIHEWPSVERIPLQVFLMYKALGLNRRMRYLKSAQSILSSWIDWYADSFFRPYMVRMGCGFLSSYERVITTRLHAMILSVLLHKSVEYIDNTTGKLSAFANTWLSDLEEVKAYRIG